MTTTTMMMIMRSRVIGTIRLTRDNGRYRMFEGGGGGDLQIRFFSSEDVRVDRQIRKPRPERNGRRRLFRGTIVHSKSLGELEILSPGILAVDARGKILFCEATDGDRSRERAEAEAAKRLVRIVPEDDEDGAISSTDAPLANDTRFREDGTRAHFTVADFEWIDLGERVLMPGFVDGHVHASQYGFVGLGVGLPLLAWLDKYTFPFESRFHDVDFAREVYEQSVTRHLRNGSTTCSYFATIHKEASQELVRIARDMGQRVYVGKVNMDRNGAQKIDYVETTTQSVEDTEEFVDHVQRLDDPLATPVITPRFVPTCTPELMRTLGDISDRETLPVQTHMSENKGEIAWVKELHPECSSYADVYDQHGLLHDRTYLAHCVHCTGGELALLAERGSAVVHCPNSNFALRSGVCNVRSMLDRGVRVGLGTDVGGGTNPSILDAMRLTMCASVAATQMHNERVGEVDEVAVERCGDEEEDSYGRESLRADKERLGEDLKDALSSSSSVLADATQEPLSMAETFYLATLGGADVLGLAHEVGNFETGKAFDALIVNGNGVEGAAGHGRSPFDVGEHETPMEVFQKFIFLGDDRNIEQVFVNGRRVL